ncbi:MAG: carboxypeptidase-like regulatory domain-containing protein [Terriglobia bacterium]
MKGCWFDLTGTPRKKTGPLSAELLVLLCLALLCPLAAQPQSPKAEGEAAGYAERAREAVLEELRRLQLPVQQFRIEVVGAPVLLPDHTHLHRPPPTKPSNTATLAGRVVDITGAPIPTVRLTLRSAPDQPGKAVSVDEDGWFKVHQLRPGRYWLRAKESGFRTTDYILNLKGNERRRVRLTLQVGASAPYIPVTTATPEPLPLSLPELPKAIALVAAYRRGTLYRSFQVYFQPETPVVFSLNVQNTPTIANSQLPLEEKEWHQVATELAPFYTTLLDITRGPERFDPYLPDTMRAYGCPTAWGIICVDSQAYATIGLSEEELRRLTSQWLDFVAHSIWYRFEGLKRPEGPRGDPGFPLDADYLRKLAGWASQNVEQMKDTLKSHGILGAAHLAISSVYLRRLVGEGMLAKESNTSHKIKGLGRDAALYYTQLYGGQCAAHIHFARIKGRLRLVEIEFD